jgi:hypothetical protein
LKIANPQRFMTPDGKTALQRKATAQTTLFQNTTKSEIFPKICLVKTKNLIQSIFSAYTVFVRSVSEFSDCPPLRILGGDTVRGLIKLPGQ